MTAWRSTYRQELAVVVAWLVLLAAVAAVRPTFFQLDNLRDLLLNNLPVLLPAIGMTLVILARQIDISIASQFAVCGVLAGVLAKAGVPMPGVALLVILAGGLLGAINGALVAYAGIPAIIVTLATMTAWRAALLWATQGAWITDLPATFTWWGLSRPAGQVFNTLLTVIVFAAFAWGMNRLAAGRAVYAVGADAEAARLAGLRPRRVVFGTFVVLGMLTALGALLQNVQFRSVQSNAAAGLELQVIACVVVGGTSIMGGRGTLGGTLIGVALLGTLGTALTFLGVEAAWENALRGAIILVAVAWDALRLPAWRRRGVSAVADTAAGSAGGAA